METGRGEIVVFQAQFPIGDQLNHFHKMGMTHYVLISSVFGEETSSYNQFYEIQ